LEKELGVPSAYVHRLRGRKSIMKTVNGIVSAHGPRVKAARRPCGVEPIALAGFAHKLPQDVTTAESLWQMLLERRSTMTEVPKNRWNIDGYRKSHGNRAGMGGILKSL